MTGSATPELLALAEDSNALVPLLPGERRIDRAGFVVCLGRDQRWTTVQHIRLAERDVEAAVGEVRALTTGRGPVQWEFGPSATPPSLEAQLVALGFSPDQEPLQTMMILMRDPEAPDGAVRARPVASAGELGEADRVMAIAFGGDQAADPERRWRSRDTTLRETFVALLDGRIVGAATVSYAAAGVVLNAGAVLPEARGRGVYRALVAARLRAARRRGLEAAVTQAGTRSRGILLRLGFEAVGEIRSYVDPVTASGS